MKNLVFCIACLSWVRGWVGGWVGVRPPPPGGGGGHLSVCGYAKILGGWVPELTPPPPGWLSKTLTPAAGSVMGSTKEVLEKLPVSDPVQIDLLSRFQGASPKDTAPVLAYSCSV